MAMNISKTPWKDNSSVPMKKGGHLAWRWQTMIHLKDRTVIMGIIIEFPLLGAISELF